MNGWGFVALGIPAAQGSSRAFVVGNRAIVTSASTKLKPWRQSILEAAPEGPSLEGPVAVRCAFTIPRAKSRPKREVTPAVGLDLDKMVRGAFDAVTNAGLWGDDKQVAYLVASKVWTGFDWFSLNVPGLAIAAVEMVGSADIWLHELDMLIRDAVQNHRDGWQLRTT